MPEPIQPTRVYTAGEQLPPAPDPAADAPPAEPAVPWWTAPGPPPAPLVIYVHHLVGQLPPPEPPTATWSWSVLWSWARWPHAGGAAAALAPVFGGWSLATGWGHALLECRTEQTIGGAWVLGLLALAVAATAARWRPRWYTAALVTTAAFGLADMASPFDLVTVMTGVRQ